MMKAAPIVLRTGFWAYVCCFACCPCDKIHAQTSSTFQINPAQTGAAVTSTPFAPPLHPLWSVDLGGFVSYPVFSNGEVIVNVSSQGLNGARMVALSAATGDIKWQKYIESYRYTPLAASDNDIVFELNEDGILQAFDPETGTRKWIIDLPLGSDFDTPPIAENGYIYIDSDVQPGTVYKISESTGAIVWGQSINSAPSFVLDKENIYAGGTCDLYSISLLTSQINWHVAGSCGGDGGSPLASIALNNNLVVAAGYDPTGLVVDKSTGAVKGTYVYSAVAAFFGNIMVEVQYKGNVTANETLSHHLIWNFQPINDSVSVPPVVINDTVYVVSNNGMLYALAAKTGKKLQAIALNGATPNGPWSYTGLGVGKNMLFAPSGNFLTALTTEATAAMAALKKSP